MLLAGKAQATARRLRAGLTLQEHLHRPIYSACEQGSLFIKGGQRKKSKGDDPLCSLKNTPSCSMWERKAEDSREVSELEATAMHCRTAVPPRSLNRLVTSGRVPESTCGCGWRSKESSSGLWGCGGGLNERLQGRGQ